MWCCVITMTTVGYGDFVPETHIGRVIAIIACIWGNFLISLMVVSLSISSEFNPSQRKAYDSIMREIGIYEHNKKAMRVVQALLKYCVRSKKKKLTKEEKLSYLNVIRECIKDFQQHRKKLFVKDQEIPLENQLLRVNQKISFEFDNILSDARSIKKTMSVLSQAEELNRDIEEKAKTVSGLSESILRKLQRFKANGFRPRINGLDSDSEDEETTTGYNGNMRSSAVIQSPTKFINRVTKEEPDNLALIKLIRNGYLTQERVQETINGILREHAEKVKAEEEDNNRSRMMQ